MENLNINKSIEVLDVTKYHGREKTEEIQDIIERMPTKFGIRVLLIVGLILSLMIFFGWFIRYPDIKKGNITINSPLAPIRLVANSSGRIKLNYSTGHPDVKSGDVIAYIKNATSFDTLSSIKKLLVNYNPTSDNTEILNQLPSKISLGELTTTYYNFYSNVHQLAIFIKDQLYDKQIVNLKNLHKNQEASVKNSLEKVNISEDNLGFTKKFLNRDSILYIGKAATEDELDKTQVQYLNSRTTLASARAEQIEARKQAQQTLGSIKEMEIQKEEKRKDFEIAVVSSYNELMENISLWEQKYLLSSPFDGKVQFLQFWSDDQFVQAQEPIFTIIPKTQEPYGQIFLPAVGAGKVQVGQEVIVKLDDFPFNEYGSIKGIIRSISLTTYTEKTQQGNVEAYLLTLKFPKGLRTNYGKIIPFRHETKGIAEIVTNDRRLIGRLFDNLSYALKK
jgi:hypothetical protein